jgi:hypothetical protein
MPVQISFCKSKDATLNDASDSAMVSQRLTRSTERLARHRGASSTFDMDRSKFTVSSETPAGCKGLATSLDSDPSGRYTASGSFRLDGC